MEIGKKIKEVLDLKGMKITEFARRLNTSNQNAHDIFKRTSLDTGLLESIGDILEYDFFQYYVKSPVTTVKKTKKARVLIEVELEDDMILKKALKDKVSQIFQ
jgi:hypothetical protein